MAPRKSVTAKIGHTYSGRPSAPASAWLARMIETRMPAAPVPATVEILPSGATRRTRWLLVSAKYRLPSWAMVAAWGR